jgi:hypothetical protein
MSRQALPRILADELLLEIQLTSIKHIVVEGVTDQRFIQAWISHSIEDATVTVTPIDSIEVDDQDVITLGLNLGNRSRVISLAQKASLIEGEVNITCVADRDTGSDIDNHNYPNLVWTDYPALESYCLEPETLHIANLLSFAEQLPDGAALLSALSEPLRELFAVRLANAHLPSPNYSAALGPSRSLSAFKVELALAPHVRPLVASYPRPQDDDPRRFGYGHDIAQLLMAAFGGVLRNKAHLGDVGAVESALKSAMLAHGTFQEESMFTHLRAWMTTSE